MTVTYQFRAGSGQWTIIGYLARTWVALLKVDCCELSLRGSFFGGFTHEFYSRFASTMGWETKYKYLKPTPLGANEHSSSSSSSSSSSTISSSSSSSSSSDGSSSSSSKNVTCIPRWYSQVSTYCNNTSIIKIPSTLSVKNESACYSARELILC